MKYLLDTDHISILQRQSGPAYGVLMSRIAQHKPTELAFSIISFHEQVLGCHTYISRIHKASDVVRGYVVHVGHVLCPTYPVMQPL